VGSPAVAAQQHIALSPSPSAPPEGDNLGAHGIGSSQHIEPALQSAAATSIVASESLAMGTPPHVSLYDTAAIDDASEDGGFGAGGLYPLGVTEGARVYLTSEAKDPLTKNYVIATVQHLEDTEAKVLLSNGNEAHVAIDSLRAVTVESDAAAASGDIDGWNDSDPQPIYAAMQDLTKRNTPEKGNYFVADVAIIQKTARIGSSYHANFNKLSVTQRNKVKAAFCEWPQAVQATVAARAAELRSKAPATTAGGVPISKPTSPAELARLGMVIAGNKDALFKNFQQLDKSGLDQLKAGAPSPFQPIMDQFNDSDEIFAHPALATTVDGMYQAASGCEHTAARTQDFKLNWCGGEINKRGVEWALKKLGEVRVLITKGMARIDKSGGQSTTTSFHELCCEFFDSTVCVFWALSLGEETFRSLSRQIQNAGGGAGSGTSPQSKPSPEVAQYMQLQQNRVYKKTSAAMRKRVQRAKSRKRAAAMDGEDADRAQDDLRKDKRHRTLADAERRAVRLSELQSYIQLMTGVEGREKPLGQAWSRMDALMGRGEIDGEHSSGDTVFSSNDEVDDDGDRDEEDPEDFYDA
jgi:hypothetical protein